MKAYISVRFHGTLRLSDKSVRFCPDAPRLGARRTERGEARPTLERTRPYCLLGFETLKDLKFRNREGGFKRETTSAPNRRSRGGSRHFCLSGTRSRRLSLPARGTSLIPGRAWSRWNSRGGCSASRGSERRASAELSVRNSYGNGNTLVMGALIEISTRSGPISVLSMHARRALRWRAGIHRRNARIHS